MEPRFKSLAVSLVPQPRQMPLPPFETDDLQRVFADVSHAYAYQSFEFIFNRRGAKFVNDDDDFVELRPALLGIQARMDGPDLLTAESAQKKVVRVFKTAMDRLGVPGFMQITLQIVAVTEVPGDTPDAKDFVVEKLMGGGDGPKELGTGYFGGGVRFRRLAEDGTGEDALVIEPFLRDNAQLLLSHQVVRAFLEQPLTELDQLGSWVDDGFEFLSNQTMRLLSR
jgi:hypothetical protein